MSAPLLFLVDDAPETQQILSLVCQRATLTLHGAISVDTAWQELMNLPTAPDLLLLDVHLPGESGLILYERMQQDADLASVKVALFSHFHMGSVIATSIETGIRFLVAKELLSEPLLLSQRLQELLEHVPEPVEQLSTEENPRPEEVLKLCQRLELHRLLRPAGKQVMDALIHAAGQEAVVYNEAMMLPAPTEPSFRKSLMDLLAQQNRTGLFVQSFRYRLTCLLGLEQANLLPW